MLMTIVLQMLYGVSILHNSETTDQEVILI